MYIFDTLISPVMRIFPIRFIAVIFFAIACNSAYSQNIGINTTGATPSSNAILDLNSGNKYNLGLIIPHVTLGAALITFSPPIANAASVKDTGMIVYNMNGTQPVGYYCWNGTAWVNISGGANSWNITGNSGTSPGTNFLGTTDAE